jgi:cytochrome c551/c552
VACHNANKKLVGPGFNEIAKRKYSVDKILQLIKIPQPQNWPEYATPMAPMPQVSESDARKIATWINSLDK